MQIDEATSAADRLKRRAAAEKKEANRLKKVYKDLSPKQFQLAIGLIQQAARLKAQLDELYVDITANGLTEWFQQSEKCEPYKRERPEAALFVKLDKNYQAIVRQLSDMLPADAETPETVTNAFDCE